MPIAVLLGGMFLSNVDIAVVNTATPAIRSGLAASAGEVELIVSAYTLAFAVLLVFCARLGGLYGFGRVYRVGLAVFVLASLACGLATGPWLLIVARVVQGAGAALLVAQVLTGIQVMSTGRQRTRALGAYTIVLAGSAVIGQVLGGLIVSANLFGTSWRPVFLLNVPLGIALFALCRTLPVGRSTTAAGRLDYPGAALLTVALGLLVFPLVLGPGEGWPGWTYGCLLAAVPAFAFFVVVERRTARRGAAALVRLELLGRRSISWTLAAAAVTGAIYFGILLVVAIYLQQGRGASAAESGLVMVPWVAAFGVAGPLLGRFSPRHRQLAGLAGTLLVAAGFAVVALLAAYGQPSSWVLALVLGIAGLGYGGTFAGTIAVLTDTVDTRYAADVSGLFNTIVRVGGVFGVAVFTTTYTATSSFVVVAVVMAASALVAAGLAAVGLTGPRQAVAEPAAGRHDRVGA
ncbi:MFS transporter [Fodinicola feengrottensis]|uniref:MFS transporter n=1 Tax=Fodinicola feengrottensis TaxID=435914 RepID=A0ABN2IQY6_9ACTN